MPAGSSRKQEHQAERAKEGADKRGAAVQRGGERSRPRRSSQEPTKEELYQEARRRNVKGRSAMTKQQLRKAVGR